MSEGIMNRPYRRRLIVAHIRKLKRVHKLGQYSDVHKFCMCISKTKTQSSVEISTIS